MNGEAKTVSELCREALELREKATLEGPLSAVEGSLVTNLVRVINSNGFEHRGQVYADLNDEWTLNELTDSEYDKRVKTGSALAASMTFNHENIKQIAERCLELEGIAVGAHLSMQRIEAENQKLREALKKAKEMNDHLFDVKKKPVSWGSTFVDWGIINQSMLAVDRALKGGQGG